MLQVAESGEVALNGSLNAEWAALPPGNSVAAIHEEGTANAIPLCWRTKARRSLMTKVFRVPPGTSKKKMPPLCSQ